MDKMNCCVVDRRTFWILLISWNGSQSHNTLHGHYMGCQIATGLLRTAFIWSEDGLDHLQQPPLDVCRFCDSRSELFVQLRWRLKLWKQHLNAQWLTTFSAWSLANWTHLSLKKRPAPNKDFCLLRHHRMAASAESICKSRALKNYWTPPASQPAFRFPPKHLSHLWLDPCCLDTVHAVVIGPYPNQ